MQIDRREFLKLTALGATSFLVGCSDASTGPSFRGESTDAWRNEHITKDRQPYLIDNLEDYQSPFLGLSKMVYVADPDYPLIFISWAWNGSRLSYDQGDPHTFKADAFLIKGPDPKPSTFFMPGPDVYNKFLDTSMPKITDKWIELRSKGDTNRDFFYTRDVLPFIKNTTQGISFSLPSDTDQVRSYLKIKFTI